MKWPVIRYTMIFYIYGDSDLEEVAKSRVFLSIKAQDKLAAGVNKELSYIIANHVLYNSPNRISMFLLATSYPCCCPARHVLSPSPSSGRLSPGHPPCAITRGLGEAVAMAAVIMAVQVMLTSAFQPWALTPILVHI